jgi:hypothetical protein
VVRAAKAESRAAKATAAAAANQVTCTDGSIGVAGRGACSGHGGINRGVTDASRAEANAEVRTAKADVRAAKAAKADEHAVKRAEVANRLAEDNNPTGAIAKCKDGLYSHAQSRQGACSRHGGVAAWK